MVASASPQVRPVAPGHPAEAHEVAGKLRCGARAGDTAGQAANRHLHARIDHPADIALRGGQLFETGWQIVERIGDDGNSRSRNLARYHPPLARPDQNEIERRKFAGERDGPANVGGALHDDVERLLPAHHGHEGGSVEAGQKGIVAALRPVVDQPGIEGNVVTGGLI